MHLPLLVTLWSAIQRWPVLSAFWVCCALFLAFPSLDLEITFWFYRPGEGFFLHDHPLAVFVYHAVLWGAAGLAVGFIAVLLGSLVPAGAFLRSRRQDAGYLLLVLVLGPGLMVNTILKDHWGRARPYQVQLFGGSQRFTPAFLPTDQCDHNCSYVSGHAAFGFYLVAFGFAGKRRRYAWLVVGLVAGTVIGLVRIVQGGHFPSDVVFSFFVVYTVAWLLQGCIMGDDALLKATRRAE
ncbi:lipid A 4'-phosphatase [Gammaproteobacteria bacterium]